MLVDKVARAINPQAFVAFDKHGRETLARGDALRHARKAISAIADWLEAQEGETRPKPTIEELERLVVAESAAPISLNPDGSVRVGPPPHVELLRSELRRSP